MQQRQPDRVGDREQRLDGVPVVLAEVGIAVAVDHQKRQLGDVDQHRPASRWPIQRLELPPQVQLGCLGHVRTSRDVIICTRGWCRRRSGHAAARRRPLHRAAFQVVAGATKAERPWPPRYVKDPLEAEQRSVLAERDDQSVGELRGAMSHAGMPDPAGLERANYCAPS
jgi:hypothetical protein